MKRLPLPAFTLALLAACTAETRNFNTGGAATTSSTSGATGGAGTTSTTSSTSTTTTATGGGGAAPMSPKCTPAGGAFDILNANDFGTDELDDKALLVPQLVNGKGQVHVVVRDRTKHELIVRSIVDDPSPLGNVAYYGGADQPDFVLATGFADAAGLHIAGGAADLGLGELYFLTDPNTGVKQAAPTFYGYDTPPACTLPNYIVRARMAQMNGTMVYLAVCGVPSQGAVSLWIGSSNLALPKAQLAAGMPKDVLMNPTVMTIVGDKLLTFFNNDFGPVVASYTADPTQIPSTVPFSLDATTGTQSFVFGAVPDTTGKRAAILAAAANLGENKGALWAGSLGDTELGALSQTPPPGMSSIFTASNLTELGGLNQPTFDKETIAAAGISISTNGVYFNWLTRDAKPLVLEYPVVTTDGSFTLIHGAAAPLGLTKLVTWIERDGSSPPQYKVRGRKLICTMGG